MIGTPHCFIYNRNAFQIQDKLVGVGEVNTARLCRSTAQDCCIFWIRWIDVVCTLQLMMATSAFLRRLKA